MNINILYGSSLIKYSDYYFGKTRYDKNNIVNILFKKFFFNGENIAKINIDNYNKVKNNKNTIHGIKNNYIDTLPIFKKIIIIDERKHKKKLKNHLSKIFMLKKWESL